MATKTPKRNSSVIKICTINIDGLSEKSRFCLDKYQDDNSFDCIAVQETRKTDIESISLCNMSAIMDSNNALNHGAALYTQDRHSIAKIEEISQDFTNIDSCWGLVVINGTRIIVGSVYVKLGTVNVISDVLSMLAKAQHISTKLKSKGVILVGDMNSRHQSWGDHTSDVNGRKLFNSLDSTKFSIMTANSPTFLCDNSGKKGSSFIDLAIVSNSITKNILKIETDTEVELWSGAPSRGHVPVIISLQNQNPEPVPTVKKISVKGIIWSDWANDIEQEIENTEYSQEDPERLLEVIEHLFSSSTEKHGKMKTISSHSKPYWNSRLSLLSNQLRIDRKRFNFRNTDRNREIFLRSKEEFDQERKRACQEFIMNKTRNLNAVESQKFWKEFKKITTKKVNQNISPLEDCKGNILTENEEMEQLLFNTFFECEHMKEASFNEEFFVETNAKFDEIMEQVHVETEDSKQLNDSVTKEEIIKNIKAIKSSGKSIDNNGLHPEMLKKVGPKCLSLFLMLFNLCLHLGNWVWQKADVIFLKKEGKKSYSIPGSYRPISITSYLGKLFERILSVRANNFLKKKNLFDPYQEGFTEKKNTIRYLNRLILDIKSDLNNGKTVICLFLDFEKAFDSIWKKGLIVKLFMLGFRGKFLKLINNFLQSRTVCLNINGNKGNVRNCSEFGLPQGSVLSPILFKIFMLDFLDEINENTATIYKFADDGSVKISADTTVDCLTQLQTVLDSLNRWAEKWRMVINCQPNKTEVICFGTAENNKNLIPSEFKLGNQKIKLVKCTKVLGITIDEDLSFTEHSKDVLKKLNTRWNMIQIYCNRNWGFSQKVLVELIRTLFLSCLLYGSHLWMNKNNIKDINSLYYKLLKTSIGAVFNIKQSIAEVIVGLPPIEIQNKINQIKHYLKLILNELPDDPLMKCVQNITSSNRLPPDLLIALRSVFKFLKWKMQQSPSKFNDEDKQIILLNNYSEFHLLSKSCGEYTKQEITKYTELLWADYLRNQFQAEGHSTIPIPRCSPLPLNPGTDRTSEVKLMSLLYENNLLNAFLYKREVPGVDSPLCSCGQEEQTAHHIITRCELVNQELRDRAQSCIQNLGNAAENNIVLLNLSRDEKFMKILSDIIGNHSDILRKDVIL